jgi:hypothetical protein
LAILGGFGLFWADSTAMAKADNMLSFERKENNVITIAKSVRILRMMACWKAL